MKLNRHGDILWQKAYVGTFEDMCFQIIPTDDDGDGIPDNGFAMAGHGSASDANMQPIAIRTLKLNSGGGIQWGKSYVDGKGLAGRGIQQTAGGDLLVTGQGSKVRWELGKALRLVKFTLHGDPVWCRSYEEEDRSYVHPVLELTQDGGILMGGMTRLYSARREDMVILKTDAEGNIPGSSLVAQPKPTIHTLTVKLVNTTLKPRDTADVGTKANVVAENASMVKTAIAPPAGQ